MSRNLFPNQANEALKRNRLPSELPELFQKKKLVEKVSSGTTLALADDKRPAVVMAPQALQLLAERLSAR